MPYVGMPAPTMPYVGMPWPPKFWRLSLSDLAPSLIWLKVAAPVLSARPVFLPLLCPARAFPCCPEVLLATGFFFGAGFFDPAKRSIATFMSCSKSSSASSSSAASKASSTASRSSSATAAPRLRTSAPAASMRRVAPTAAQTTNGDAAAGARDGGGRHEEAGRVGARQSEEREDGGHCGAK